MDSYIPQSAIDRLQDAKKSGEAFGGDLTPRDILSLKQIGFQPQGLVFGACVISMGTLQSAMYSGEMHYLVDGYTDAFLQTMNRLGEEAKMLGATGVVNIKYEAGLSFGEGLIFAKAFGTAVTHTQHGSFLDSNGNPFLCDLDSAHFGAMFRLGYIPTNICYGTANNPAGYGLFIGAWQNREEPYMTQSTYVARNAAMYRMNQVAEYAGSEGIINLKMNLDRFLVGSGQNSQEIYFVSCTAMGTGIRRHREIIQPLAKPTFSISLLDKNQSQL